LPVLPSAPRFAFLGDDERVPLPDPLLDVVLAAEPQDVLPGRVPAEPEEPAAGAEGAGGRPVLPVEADLLARRALLGLGLEPVPWVGAGDRDVPGGALQQVALDALQPALAHGPVRAGAVDEQPAVPGGLLPRRPDLSAPGVLERDLVVGVLVAGEEAAEVLPGDAEDAVADGEVAVGVLVLAMVAQGRVPRGEGFAVERGDPLRGTGRGKSGGATHQQGKGARHWESPRWSGW